MESGRESKERRGLNMIWTAASDYGFTPLFVSYDRYNEPDLYFNTIMGLCYRSFPADEVNEYLLGLQRGLFGALLVDIFWLAMESTVFALYQEKMAALERLRYCWAESLLYFKGEDSMQYLMMRRELADTLRKERCLEILGKAGELHNPWEKKLYGSLFFQNTDSFASVQAEYEALIKKYFLFTPKAIFSSAGRHFTFGAGVSWLLRRLLPMEQSLQGNSNAVGGSIGQLASWQLEKSAKSSKLKQIQEKYPHSLLSEGERLQWERRICTGNHKLCHFYFCSSNDHNHGDANRNNANAQNQFQGNKLRYTLEINKLTSMLQNTLFMAQEPWEKRSRQGEFDIRHLWQALYLDDDRCFQEKQTEPLQDFTVVLLLDGSASRSRQAELIAAQSYVIAESLSRCSIPNMLLSYSTQDGYTILQLLKDVHEESEGAFSYAAEGWNRDGLALRAVGELLHQRNLQNVLLLVLSDVMPSDIQGLPVQGLKVMRQYSEELALEDVAAEMKALRKQGLTVAGIINSIAPLNRDNAFQVFGRSYVKIEKIERLAAAVTRFAEQHINKGIQGEQC